MKSYEEANRRSQGGQVVRIPLSWVAGSLRRILAGHPFDPSTLWRS